MKKEKMHGDLPEDDYIFFRNAYNNNPKARADINKTMKQRGMTEKEVAEFFAQGRKVVKSGKK